MVATHLDHTTYKNQFNNVPCGGPNANRHTLYIFVALSPRDARGYGPELRNARRTPVLPRAHYSGHAHLFDLVCCQQEDVCICAEHLRGSKVADPLVCEFFGAEHFNDLQGTHTDTGQVSGISPAYRRQAKHRARKLWLSLPQPSSVQV